MGNHNFHKKYLKVNEVYSCYIDAHTTSENNVCRNNAHRTNKKIPSKHSKTTFAQFTRKPKINSPRNTTLLLQLCPYMQFTDITRACITQSASLACLETKPAAIHEHTHCTTTERDNRLMRPKTDLTNDPTKVTNTKKLGRHKYLLLVHTRSTYMPLYSKLENRVLLLIGWPLSSFLQLERFLNFSLGIHRNASSNRLSYCTSLVIRNNTRFPMKHANPSNAFNVSFVYSRRKSHTLGICTSVLNVC